jgi:hypothetical protein
MAATGTRMPPILKTKSPANSEVTAAPIHASQARRSANPTRISRPATVGITPIITGTASV